MFWGEMGEIQNKIMKHSALAEWNLNIDAYLQSAA